MNLGSSLPNKSVNTNKRMNYISVIIPTVNGLQEVGGAPMRDLLNYWKESNAKVYPEQVIEVGEHVSSRKRSKIYQRPRANAYVPENDDRIDQLIGTCVNGYESPNVEV
jgi:hypothetical protein